jgi:hypothetical protein
MTNHMLFQNVRSLPRRGVQRHQASLIVVVLLWLQMQTQPALLLGVDFEQFNEVPVLAAESGQVPIRRNCLPRGNHFAGMILQKSWHKFWGY